MSTRSLLAAALPVVVAAIALSASAQNRAPAVEEPITARDKAMVEAAFGQADANGDGQVTRAELAAEPALAASFDRLDRDHDGRLSLEEFAVGFTARSMSRPAEARAADSD